MTQKIQQRRGTAALAAANNEILSSGEFGVETDTGLFKVGDGVRAWNALPYASGTVVDATNSVKGKVLLDTPPLTPDVPKVIGVNSPVISNLTARIDNLATSIVPTPDATELLKGKVFLDAPPVNRLIPIAVAPNSPIFAQLQTQISTIQGGASVVKSSSGYSSVESVFASIGSQNTILVLSSNLDCLSNVVVPPNVFIEPAGGKIIKQGTGTMEFAGLGLLNPMSERPVFSGFTYQQPDTLGRNVAGDVKWTGAEYPHKISSGIFDAPTSSDRINLADRAFLGKRVEIVATPGMHNLPVHLNLFHSLTFLPGLFSNQLQLAYESMFWLYGESVIKGAGRGATIVEESSLIDSPGNYSMRLFYGISERYSLSPEPERADFQIQKNITICDMTLKGHPNQPMHQNHAAIYLGNAHNGLVENNKFDGVHSFAAYVGVQSNNDKSAENCQIVNNYIRNSGSQSVGCISCDGLSIRNNDFVDDGQYEASNMAARAYANFIDLEPNEGCKILQNISITGNTFNAIRPFNLLSGTKYIPARNIISAITVQAIMTKKVRNVLIANNQIIGSFPDSKELGIVNSVDVSGVENLKISGNSVVGSSNLSILATSCSLMSIDNNSLTNASIISLEGCADSVLKDNTGASNINTYQGFDIYEKNTLMRILDIKTTNNVTTLTFGNPLKNTSSKNIVYDYWVGQKVRLSEGGINAGIYTIASVNSSALTATLVEAAGNGTNVLLTTAFDGNNKFINNLNAQYHFENFDSNAVPVDNVNLAANTKTITADYSLTRSDNGKTILVNSPSPITVTVPNAPGDYFGRGFEVTVVQGGSGNVMFSNNGQTSISSRKLQEGTAGHLSVVKLKAISPNNFILSGDTGGAFSIVKRQVDVGRTAGGISKGYDTYGPVVAGSISEGGYEPDTFKTAGTHTDTYAPTNTTSNQPPPEVFLNGIYAYGTGDASWNLPGHTPGANVKVTLYMLSPYTPNPTPADTWTADISINGAVVESNVDAVARAGGNGRALRLVYWVAAPANGQIIVTVHGVSNYPVMSAIRTTE